ncbi:hypothetical protein K466DRAFT_590975 [Polyporus arcularius HHB13444]|uniref:Uncharacterized protein n=1 Tax=Polyporus arcularius HHB13444 TaxID=1314778 RepID=A0A5C3NWX4_9APHY|nr:hypothetical protein K466DRAFT_590975 [Polyporus arcularius HHB13444]
MEYVEKGRPLLHYGIGFRMDEVVRFTTEHNRLEAPIRSSLAGMHYAESLADYLSVKAHANITVERPLSMEYDWVLAWQNTSHLFRKPGITKSARKVIDEEVQKIVGEARKPLWWWDDANTLPRSDPQGN